MQDIKECVHIMQVAVGNIGDTNLTTDNSSFQPTNYPTINAGQITTSNPNQSSNDGERTPGLKMKQIESFTPTIPEFDDDVVILGGLTPSGYTQIDSANVYGWNYTPPPCNSSKINIIDVDEIEMKSRTFTHYNRPSKSKVFMESWS